jgi:hypothetical protein
MRRSVIERAMFASGMRPARLGQPPGASYVYQPPPVPTVQGQLAPLMVGGAAAQITAAMISRQPTAPGMTKAQFEQAARALAERNRAAQRLREVEIGATGVQGEEVREARRDLVRAESKLSRFRTILPAQAAPAMRAPVTAEEAEWGVPLPLPKYVAEKKTSRTQVVKAAPTPDIFTSLADNIEDILSPPKPLTPVQEAMQTETYELALARHEADAARWKKESGEAVEYAKALEQAQKKEEWYIGRAIRQAPVVEAAVAPRQFMPQEVVLQARQTAPEPKYQPGWSPEEIEARRSKFGEELPGGVGRLLSTTALTGPEKIAVAFTGIFVGEKEAKEQATRYATKNMQPMISALTGGVSAVGQAGKSALSMIRSLPQAMPVFQMQITAPVALAARSVAQEYVPPAVGWAVQQYAETSQAVQRGPLPPGHPMGSGLTLFDRLSRMGSQRRVAPLSRMETSIAKDVWRDVKMHPMRYAAMVAAGALSIQGFTQHYQLPSPEAQVKSPIERALDDSYRGDFTKLYLALTDSTRRDEEKQETLRSIWDLSSQMIRKGAQAGRNVAEYQTAKALGSARGSEVTEESEARRLVAEAKTDQSRREAAQAAVYRESQKRPSWEQSAGGWLPMQGLRGMDEIAGEYAGSRRLGLAPDAEEYQDTAWSNIDLEGPLTPEQLQFIQQDRMFIPYEMRKFLFGTLLCAALYFAFKEGA